LKIVAVFGPTAAGKTGVSVALGVLLRELGESPIAVSCDAIQVYDGLEVLSGAASAAERERLEHRLLSFVPVADEFSAGRFAELAHAEIDRLLDEGRRPIVVGGTGLYLRAALADLELRPRVPAEIRAAVEHEIGERGLAAVRGELDPDVAATAHPNDRKRIARLAELQRAGVAPHLTSDELWSEHLRRPATLVGLTVERDELERRVAARVDAMAAADAAGEARRALERGASRTARAAIGFDEFLDGDVDAVKRAHLAYARRQLTWMRKMPGVRLIDRTGRGDEEVAAEIAAGLG
jgi:tRNA dimethylallyltransferase